MRVLLTGATGFLGKRVLELLLEDPAVEGVDVVTRTKISHPDLRVRIASHDLSDPTIVGSDLGKHNDVVVHLAGLYDFAASYSQNYLDNVLTAVNLAALMKERRRSSLRVVVASTYAVGFESEKPLDEKSLSHVPSRRSLFPHTKAVAEKVFTDSGLPGAVLRLGVLVGDTVHGRIERITGPYYLLQLAQRFGRVPGAKLVHELPVPLRAGGVLPLVPVDCAARIFVEAALRPPAADGAMPIYEVYNPTSVDQAEFARAAFQRLLPWAKPKPFDRIPEWMVRLQEPLTKVPSAIFAVALRPVPLGNPAFAAAFPTLSVPAFESYQEAFFDGFAEFASGRAHAL